MLRKLRVSERLAYVRVLPKLFPDGLVRQAKVRIGSESQGRSYQKGCSGYCRVAQAFLKDFDPPAQRKQQYEFFGDESITPSKGGVARLER